MTFHIRSRGIAVLGPVQVTMKNKEGTWRGSGNFSYRTMTLRRFGGLRNGKDGPRLQQKGYLAPPILVLSIKGGYCRDRVLGRARFICYGGDWYREIKLVLR